MADAGGSKSIFNYSAAEAEYLHKCGCSALFLQEKTGNVCP